MDNIFALDFVGGPFRIFSTSHLVALGVIVLLNLYFILNRMNFSPTDRRNIRYTLAVVLILNEASWHVWHLFTGTWTIQEMLPLHLCSVLVWSGAYMLIRKHTGIYEFAYLIGIAGALQALLTPDLGIYDFPHFRYYQTFISHGLLITAPIYMTVVEGLRPYPRSLRNIALWGNVYLIVVTLLNFAIGSNYLFTAHKPATASLLDVLPAWPWYIAVIELLAAAFVLLFYLPFWIMDLRERSKQAALTQPL
jgi:hypothetical integral membrane protein (TIGR02206 family)